jgi:hypothetical protein
MLGEPADRRDVFELWQLNCHFWNFGYKHNQSILLPKITNPEIFVRRQTKISDHVDLHGKIACRIFFIPNVPEKCAAPANGRSRGQHCVV